MLVYKILGRYTGQADGDFPLDAEALAYIRDNGCMAEMIGAIAGNKVILSGCKVVDGYRGLGYVYVKTLEYPEGEVLCFTGGNSNQNAMYVHCLPISVTAEGKTYQNAHERRCLVSGTTTDEEMFYWSDFTDIEGMTNKVLKSMLDERTMVGMIVLYPSSQAPNEHWIECNGASYSGQTYPELYEILKAPGGSMSFNVPNIAATGGCKYYIYAGKKVGIS